MISILSHSAFVHVPLALAVLFPGMYLTTFWAVKKSHLAFNIWYGALALCVVQLSSSLLAYFSGEYAEVLSAADPDLIESHEHFGAMFMLLWVLISVAVAALCLRPKLSNKIHPVTLLLMLIQLVIAILLGRVGGSLIQH